MRHFIAFLFLTAVLPGCYLTHGLDFAPPVVMTSDAGVMPVGDAGPITVTPDTGSPAFADAGTDAGPLQVELVMNPFFSGWDTGLGMPDMIGYTMDFTATRQDLEFSRFLVRIDGRDGALVRGSAGTPVVTDITFIDVDTGETVMGPIELPASVPPGATTSGMMALSASDGFRLAAGTTRRISVRVDLSRTEDAVGEFTRRDEHGGIYSIWFGMEGSTLMVPSDVSVAGGSPLVAEQIEGNEEAAYSGFHIYPVPTLTVSADPREGRIVTPGNLEWHNLGRTDLCAHDGTVRVRSIGVHAFGDASTYEEVVLHTPRGESGRATVPPGIDSEVEVLFDTPLEIEDGTCTFVILGARLANVEARVAEETDPGHPYSGLPVALELAAGSSWRGYGGHLHIRATDHLGHVPVYVPGEEAVHHASVIRAVTPFINGIGGNLLTRNGERGRIHHLSLVANRVGGWSLRSFAMLVSNNDAEWAPGACLHSFRFQHDSVELPAGDYRIVDDAGNDLRSATACYRPSSTFNHVWIEFTSELDVPSSTETRYWLTAVPSGFANGDTVATFLFRRSSTVPVTGCLSDSPGGYATLREIHSFSGTPAITRPTFLWSDRSQGAAHSADVARSSCDWTNEVFAWHESSNPPTLLVVE